MAKLRHGARQPAAAASLDDDSSPRDLAQGHKHLRLDYVDRPLYDYTQHGGEAYLKLFWYSPNQGQRILPASQLYSS